MDAFEHRLERAEENIKELFRGMRDMLVTQAKMDATLENLNITLRELKGAMLGLQGRPGGWLDKIIQAIITAVIAAAVAAVVGGLAK